MRSKQTEHDVSVTSVRMRTAPDVPVSMTVFPAHSSLAEILVLDGTAAAGRMAPPTSTRISARMKCVQGHSSPVNVLDIDRYSLA